MTLPQPVEPAVFRTPGEAPSGGLARDGGGPPAAVPGTTECYQALLVQRNATIEALRDRLRAYEGVAVAARVAIIAYWNFDQTTSTRHIVAMRIGDLDAKLADLDALGATER